MVSLAEYRVKQNPLQLLLKIWHHSCLDLMDYSAEIVVSAQVLPESLPQKRFVSDLLGIGSFYVAKCRVFLYIPLCSVPPLLHMVALVVHCVLYCWTLLRSKLQSLGLPLDIHVCAPFCPPVHQPHPPPQYLHNRGGNLGHGGLKNLARDDVFYLE